MTASSRLRQMVGFSNVDRAGNPGPYIAALDRLAAELTEVKQRLIELGGFASASLWLDLGCGVGHDLDDRAVGVDLSVALLDEARRRFPTANLVAAEGERLPFRDSVFDGCRIERVLQHVVDPGAILAEVGRVLQPGGRIAIFEPDWGSLTFKSSDAGLDQAFAASVAARRANGRTGRELGRLLDTAGFRDVALDPDTVSFHSLAYMYQTLGLRQAIERVSATLGQERVSNWVKELERQERDGELRVDLTRWFAVGTRLGAGTGVDA